MTALGEVATFLPIPGAFASYATRLVDPSLGFAMGWIYWFSWASTFALELVSPTPSLLVNYYGSASALDSHR
jgi:amino acid transporter